MSSEGIEGTEGTQGIQGVLEPLRGQEGYLGLGRIVSRYCRLRLLNVGGLVSPISARSSKGRSLPASMMYLPEF